MSDTPGVQRQVEKNLTELEEKLIHLTASKYYLIDGNFEFRIQKGETTICLMSTHGSHKGKTILSINEKIGTKLRFIGFLESELHGEVKLAKLVKKAAEFRRNGSNGNVEVYVKLPITSEGKLIRLVFAGQEVNGDCNLENVFITHNVMICSDRADDIARSQGRIVAYLYGNELLNKQLVKQLTESMFTKFAATLQQAQIEMLKPLMDQILGYCFSNKEQLTKRELTEYMEYLGGVELLMWKAPMLIGEGRVYGFATKAEATEMLREQQIGSFVIYFVLNEFGKIGISWVRSEIPHTEVEHRVWNVDEFTNDAVVRLIAEKNLRRYILNMGKWIPSKWGSVCFPRV